MNIKKSRNENFNIPLKDLKKYFIKSFKYSFYTLICTFLFFWILWFSTEFISNKLVGVNASAVDYNESESLSSDSSLKDESVSELNVDSVVEKNDELEEKDGKTGRVSFTRSNSFSSVKD